MSQYNKTVLTHAGLELAKRANAGQAKFGITRAVTSADDWSHKTVQDLEEVTTIPNIMQQGTIMDTDEVESNNSVIGVSLCFTNKNLSTGYQIRIIGLYVKEEGQENDFLYAVTTAITPEFMPSFADKVLYKFSMQMYLVIGKAQAVNVVINEGTAVTHGQLDKYKAEVTGNLKKLENTHKEDMSHVAKSASINGGAEILPDSTGKLNLVVPDPDLSKYVSLEQLGELLQAKANVADVNKQIKAVTDLANAKANSADVYTKTETDNQINKFDLSKVKFRKQYLNGDGQATDKTWSATKNEDGTYTIDLCNDDWTAAKLADVLAQLPNKANASDVYTKAEVDSKTSGTVITAYDIASKTPTKVTDSYRNKWLVDQNALSQFADQINQLKGRRTVDAPDFNTLTDSGVYLISSPDKGKNFPIGSWGVLVVFNGDSQRTEQIYFTDDGANVFMRTYGWINGTTNWCNWNQIAWKSDISNLQNTVNEALKSLIPDDTHAPALPAGFDLNNYFIGWRRSVNTTLKNMPFGWLSDTMYFQGTVAGSDGRFEIALYIGNGPNANPKIAYRFYGWDHWKPWVLFADNDDISNLQNQIQQLRESQFEVQTFTDATAAANWEAQKPGKRMAIVNS